MSDIVERIDQAIGCHQCGRALDDSPSADFCSEQCQQRWHEKRSVPLTDSASTLYHVARYWWAGLVRPARGGTIPPRTTTSDTILADMSRKSASVAHETEVIISRHGGTHD